MEIQNEKCVMVIDESLPISLAANTAAILGITLGKRLPEIVGGDVQDKDGCAHLGIVSFPVPILKGSRESIGQLRQRLRQPDFESLTVVDFSDLAQSCKAYDEFIRRMKNASGDELCYLGLAICGERKKVASLTGSMGLLK